MRYSTVLAFLIVLAASVQDSARAQSYAEHFPPYTLTNTQQRVLHSQINGVTYKLYVSLPAGYDPAGDTAYPVVYLLDADYSFAIAKNVTDHLEERGHLEPAILVGIAYAGTNRYRHHRTRDYTPTHTEEGGYSRETQEVSGGAPAFLDFLTRELFPYIEREFRAADRRILSGHSYGGLFASWVLLTRPSAFDGYVVVSPSLWYDDRYLFGLLENLPPGWPDRPMRAWFGVGSREVNASWNMPEDLRAFTRRLAERNGNSPYLEVKVSEGETHNSIFPSAFTTGIRFVLEGY